MLPRESSEMCVTSLGVRTEPKGTGLGVKASCPCSALSVLWRCRAERTKAGGEQLPLQQSRELPGRCS